jgi:hypothetical protein
MQVVDMFIGRKNIEAYGVFSKKMRGIALFKKNFTLFGKKMYIYY